MLDFSSGEYLDRACLPEQHSFDVKYMNQSNHDSNECFGTIQSEICVSEPLTPIILTYLIRGLYLMLEFGPRTLKTVKRVLSCGLGCVVLCRFSMDQGQQSGGLLWNAQSFGTLLVVLSLAVKLLLKVFRLLNLFKTRKKLRIIKLFKLAKYEPTPSSPVHPCSHVGCLACNRAPTSAPSPAQAAAASDAPPPPPPPPPQAGQAARLRREARVGPPPPEAASDAQAHEGAPPHAQRAHAHALAAFKNHAHVHSCALGRQNRRSDRSKGLYIYCSLHISSYIIQCGTGGQPKSFGAESFATIDRFPILSAKEVIPAPPSSAGARCRARSHPTGASGTGMCIPLRPQPQPQPQPQPPTPSNTHDCRAAAAPTRSRSPRRSTKPLICC